MTAEELRNKYKEFSTCYSELDFIKKVEELNQSCESYYLDNQGCGTQEITDVLDMIEGNKIDGYINIEVHNEYGNIVPIHIPCEIYCEDWLEDEQCFGVEGVSIKGIEEW
jgi:hypothetical protein